MTCFGVHFNYEIEHRDTWLFCSVTIAVTAFLTVSLIFTPYDYQNYSTLGLVYFFVSSLLEDSIVMLTSISFVVLLRSLHTRFVGLNSLLRFHFNSSHACIELFCKLSIFSETETNF